MRPWQSGAAISPTVRTGSSPPPSSTGGQLSSKTVPVEAFTRRWYEPPAKEECVSRPVRQVGIRVQPGCQSAAITVRSVTRRRHGGVSNGERGGSLGRTRLHPYGTAFRASDLEPQDRAVILRRLDRENLLSHSLRALSA